MKTIKLFLTFFTIILIAQSCRKDSDDFDVTPPFTEPQISVVASVLGTVIDENGTAVEGATVTFENESIQTDENGVFQFIDESLYSNGTYITVTKNGFFDGSRTFYASKGKTSIVALELIPLNEIGEFNSETGSKLTFENVELDFKSNSIVTEDGSTYSGNVNVAAKYLDPTILNTMNQMPGDLTGVSTDQNRVALTSIAMITVELTDDNGNELQVQEGKLVDVRIPVPQSLQNAAPSSIPMWHFDEEKGIWIEEGSADLVNGVYITSLPHFSFWNCDVPSELIFLKGSVVNRSVPIQGVDVVITLTNGGTSGYATTDAEGFFCGYVPKGEDLILEIFDQCGNVIYTINIPASEIDIILDPINLLIELNVVTLSGSVALCNGTPSPQTYISASQGSLNNIIVINDDFTFSANIFYCNDDFDLFVSAVDIVNVLVSETFIYTIDGDIVVGEIILCEENTQLIDPRDGEIYDLVEINGQIWTVQNMRFDTEDELPLFFDAINNQLPENYGRYYSHASKDLACPIGWHIARDLDFRNLYIGTGEPIETEIISVKSTEGWINDGNGTNSKGLDIVPAGYMFSGIPFEIGETAHFWTDQVFTTTSDPFTSYFDYVNNAGSFGFIEPESKAVPIRCIKD